MSKQAPTPKYDQSDCPLAAGEMVEHSGIYEICHVDEPRVTVVLTRNTIFPLCRRCGDAVRYKLIQSAPHISEDPDFLEEFTETDNPKYIMAVPETRFPFQLGVAHGFRFWQNVVQTWGESAESGDL
jgi:hypothetical protein